MGRITKVQNDLASVSIGQAQGVKPGMELIIYRGAKYLGKLRITQVLPNEAAGDLKQVQGVIRSGDNVTDKLQ